jgi:hypothetical protein
MKLKNPVNSALIDQISEKLKNHPAKEDCLAFLNGTGDLTPAVALALNRAFEIGKQDGDNDTIQKNLVQQLLSSVEDNNKNQLITMFVIAEISFAQTNQAFRGRCIAKGLLQKTLEQEKSADINADTIAKKIHSAIHHAPHFLENLPPAYKASFNENVQSLIKNFTLLMSTIFQLKPDNTNELITKLQDKYEKMRSSLEPQISNNLTEQAQHHREVAKKTISASPEKLAEQVKNVLEGKAEPTSDESPRLFKQTKDYFTETKSKVITRNNAKEQCLQDLRTFINSANFKEKETTIQLTTLISHLYAACLNSKSKELKSRIEKQLSDYVMPGEVISHLKKLGDHKTTSQDIDTNLGRDKDWYTSRYSKK